MSRVADPKNANQRSVTVSAESFLVLRAASYHSGLKMVTILNELIANATPDMEVKYGFKAENVVNKIVENN